MRGISIPTYRFSRTAYAYLEAKQAGSADKAARSLLGSSCRCHTRIVLRLRAQAEAVGTELSSDKAFRHGAPLPVSQINIQKSLSQDTQPSSSQPSSPSATQSPSVHAVQLSSPRSHASARSENGRAPSSSSRYTKFESSLYKPGHAPLLRVFVPSSETWLSDEGLLDCEKELKRAGVISLLRVGDVVWDAAVGDEANVGRLIWDGNYLIVSCVWAVSYHVDVY